MSRQIFVNLPVKDLKRSIAFFENLGFSFNAQFTNHEAACMVVSETIYVMLLTHEKFSQFTPHPIADAKQATEVLVALSCDSRAAVDDIVAKATANGATTYNSPQDYGFMYSHAFQDLDGHIWEWLWMDPSAIKQG